MYYFLETVDKRSYNNNSDIGSVDSRSIPGLDKI